VSERSALLLVRVAGAAVLGIFLAFQAVNPKAPVVANTPGFRDPVAGFDLASTLEHVFGILGRPGTPGRDEAVRRMKLGTRLDFLFLLAYQAFYVGIAFVARERGVLPPLAAAFVVALAVTMSVGDALENRELLRLADTVDAAAMMAALGRLRVFTLAKWHALFGASLVVGVSAARLTGWWRWSAPFFVLAGVVGFTSVVHLPSIEWSILPVGVAWTLAWIAALRTRTPPGAPTTRAG